MRSLAFFLALTAAVPAASQQTAADSARVYGLHEVEVLPRPQNVPDFTAALHSAYPPHLRDAGVGGTVQVAFVVGPDGTPGDVRVISTPDSSFSAPSVQAVSLLRFTPAQVRGRAVAVRVEQPITWRSEAAPAAARAPVVPDSIHVYAVDEADARPLPRNFRDFETAVQQLYPAELRGTKARAEVMARFAVDPAGVPRYAHVLQSTNPRFDAPTLDAVGRLRFDPAQRGGEPAWVWLEVPVEWTDPMGRREAARGDSINGYELAVVDELPRLVNGTVFGRALQQAYPPALRDARVQASVTVRFRVEPDGTISQAEVTESSDVRFNQPTLLAVNVLRFRPARLNGRPVRVWVDQPIRWTVAEGGAEWSSQGYERDRSRFGPLPAPCSVRC
jgi:TonB family protein